MVTVKEIENFKDYGKCVSISNGKIEALVTVDLGPRVIFFGFVGGQNFMCADRKGLGYSNDGNYTEFFGEGKKWESFGGHRVWLSPESYPETYTPDDKSVKYTATKDGAIFVSQDDIEIGVAKTLELNMSDNDNSMSVTMNVKNISNIPKEFSVWSISVCSANGTLVIPLNTNDTDLLPNRSISIWPYTDMRDNRIYWGNKYITINQDTAAQKPIKLGVDLNCGTAYYLLGKEIFKKNYKTNHKTGNYPDGGCSFESYTNNLMLEFETLSELKTVNKGETHTLTELWSLCKKPCEVDFRDDNSIADMLEKI